MSRPDISPYLVHFTSGDSQVAAFTRLRKIISDSRLIGGSRCIKGDYRCVCFSEAPLTSLKDGLVNQDHYSRYSPFGIMVSKQWLFEQGGRPVIYQPESEYHDLPETHRWRHHRFELFGSKQRVDFTWEREWRIKCDHLVFDRTSARIVALNRSWADRLASEHDREEHYRVMQYALIFDDVLAEQYRESFQWTVLTLN